MTRPSALDVLRAWTFEPAVVVLVLAAALMYVEGVRRAELRHSGSWPRSRAACFVSGLGLLYIALASPVGAYADALLWVHMVQHLLLSVAVPSLILLGAPVTLALRAGSTAAGRRLTRALARRPVRALTNPLVAWSLFAGVMVGTHFSPLYELSLNRAWVHWIEHALYLSAGLLFCLPLVGIDPGTRGLTHPLRVLYLFLAGPLNTVLALAIYSSARPLYPHYARGARAWGPAPLADQQLAGVLMWVAGDLILVAALGAAVAAWMRHDRATAERLERSGRSDPTS